MNLDDLLKNPNFKRLIACLFGGFVLALTIGDQEGSQDDFGVSFSKATSEPRLIIFLLIGVGIFLLVSFWSRIAPSLNHSAVQGMAQAAHGSAPDIAGTGRANPVAMMQSGAMLLDWLGIRHRDEALREAGRRVIEAVERTVAEGVATPDLGGTATTDEFTTAAVQAIS